MIEPYYFESNVWTPVVHKGPLLGKEAVLRLIILNRWYSDFKNEIKSVTDTLELLSLLGDGGLRLSRCHQVLLSEGAYSLARGLFRDISRSTPQTTIKVEPQTTIKVESFNRDFLGPAPVVGLPEEGFRQVSLFIIPGRIAYLRSGPAWTEGWYKLPSEALASPTVWKKYYKDHTSLTYGSSIPRKSEYEAYFGCKL